jgi:hypothetical protein
MSPRRRDRSTYRRTRLPQVSQGITRHALKPLRASVFRSDISSFQRPQLALPSHRKSGEHEKWAYSPEKNQTSVPSARARASSTSTPRYLTVVSIFVWPSRIWTALRLPVCL